MEKVNSTIRQYIYDQYWLSLKNDVDAINRLNVCAPKYRHEWLSSYCRKLGNAFELDYDPISSEIKAMLAAYFAGDEPEIESKQEAPKMATFHNEASIYRTVTAYKEYNAMKNNIDTPLYETINFVRGMPIKDMSPQQLLDTIREVEGEIASLKAIKTKTKFVDNRVKDLEAGLAEIVKELDSRA